MKTDDLRRQTPNDSIDRSRGKRLELAMGLGHHVICVGLGCDPRLTGDPYLLLRALEELCQARGLTVLERFTHTYAPHGLTVGLVIGESHIILHTWPEHDLAHIDFFSCVPFDQESLMADLHAMLGAAKIEVLYTTLNRR